VAITVSDPKELAIPSVGLIEVEDGETGRRALLDFRSAKASLEFERVAAQLAAERRAIFKRAKVDEISLRTDQEYFEPLIRFFQAREQRLKWRY
jgi:uncharacterized protein (DUF58 family)